MKAGPRRAVLSALAAFVVHAVFAIVVLSSDALPGGANVGGWDMVRVLRLLDWPMSWAIDGVHSRWLVVPLEPPYGRAYLVNRMLVYVLVGGAFYAAFGAMMAWVLEGNRRARHGAAAGRQESVSGDGSACGECERHRGQEDRSRRPDPGA